MKNIDVKYCKRHIIKRTLLYMKRIFHIGGKKIKRYLSYSLLVISLALSLITILPSLFCKCTPLYKIGFTKVCVVSGNVYEKSGDISTLAKNIKINIGGYSAVSDEKGHYSLSFTAKEEKNIPVSVMSQDGKYVVKIFMIDLEDKNYKLQKDIVID